MYPISLIKIIIATIEHKTTIIITPDTTALASNLDLITLLTTVKVAKTRRKDNSLIIKY